LGAVRVAGDCAAAQRYEAQSSTVLPLKNGGTLTLVDHSVAQEGDEAQSWLKCSVLPTSGGSNIVR